VILGQTEEQITEALFKSRGTVSNHKNSINKKRWAPIQGILLTSFVFNAKA
jgi:DNA-binding CsgD family transcriptional regulator